MVWSRKLTEKIILMLVITTLLLSVMGLRNEASNRDKVSSRLHESGPVFNIKSNNGSASSISVCLTTAKTTLSKFSKYTGSLSKVTIHDDSTLRRGLSNAKVMYLRCLHDQEEFENVIIHEIGHVVDLGFLKASSHAYKSGFSDFGAPIYMDDRSVGFYSISWKSNNDLLTNALPTDFVSIYGSSDPFEDFAEAFLTYYKYGGEFRNMIKSRKSLTLKSKYDFLRENVFEGVEFGLHSDKVELQSGQESSYVSVAYDATKLYQVK